ncbi:MAG: prolyl oligopeptidase family serine peptidase [Acidimicrobiales bacterium]
MYLNGKFEKEANTFTDFISCARFLIDNRSQPRPTGVSGRLDGGLLVGAVVNLAPELFSCIVAQVPFVDALSTILDPRATAHSWRMGGVGQPGRE